METDTALAREHKQACRELNAHTHNYFVIQEKKIQMLASFAEFLKLGSA